MILALCQKGVESIGNLGTIGQLYSLTPRRHYKVQGLVKITNIKAFDVDFLGVHMILFMYII